MPWWEDEDPTDPALQDDYGDWANTHELDDFGSRAILEDLVSYNPASILFPAERAAAMLRHPSNFNNPEKVNATHVPNPNQ